MPEAVDYLHSMLWKLDSARRVLSRNDLYYEGDQPIQFMAPAMKAEFGERITALVLNWPAMVADAVEARLDVEGFRYAGDSSGDDSLWNVWQVNDLDEQSQQGHLESIALSRSYVLLGPGEDGRPPRVTVESPMQVWADRDPATRRVVRAVKQWTEGELDGSAAEYHAMQYMPGWRAHWVWDSKAAGWRVSGKPVEYEGEPDLVPVVPLVNRPRILRPDGRSEYHDVIPLADAANKMATDMMVSGEYHAMPRRWGVGVSEKDFQDQAGNPLNPWSRDAGTLWATENKEARFGQFAEANLENFHKTIKLLSDAVLQLTGLPPHYGLSSGGESNPASADAIRSSESQLVKRVERKQTYLGGAWEQVMRTALRIQEGSWDEKAWTLETIWRDPSTPTVAQKADAVMKLATPIQNGRAVVPLEQARIDLGYTPEQRTRMAEMDREAMQDPYLGVLQAKEAAVTDGEPAPVG